MFRQGLHAYHAGLHYEAHEYWEELWQDENDDQRRRFLQALIQITSAVHKAQNNVGPRGCLRLLTQAGKKLAGLPSPFMGLDVETLRQGLPLAHDAIEVQLKANALPQLTTALIPTMQQLTATPIWLRLPAPAAVPDPQRLQWFERGLSLYAQGDFFEAHEAWEELWRDEPDPQYKRYLQGLIQVAAAMYKLFGHKMPKPAARLLRRALGKFDDFPPHHHGIDLLRLRYHAVTIIEELEAGVTAERASAMIPPPIAPVADEPLRSV